MARGIIRVSPELWENGLGKPFTSEEWQKALLLPDSYRLIETRCNPLLFGNCGHYITVESDAIPEAVGRNMPWVTPIYGVTDGKAFLIRINIG
jgi:hypothetical protein